jgi:hypothetical protein
LDCDTSLGMWELMEYIRMIKAAGNPECRIKFYLD